jgi:ribosomal protein S18 acetylase RimI-like enzyme
MDDAPPFVRPATLADAPVANRILYSTLRSYAIKPDPGETAFSLRADAIERVAQIGEELVGFASMRERFETEDNEGWLSKLFVDSAWRRRGAGRLLLDEMVTHARARGWVRLCLSTRSVFTEAIALYESYGFRRGPAPLRALGRNRTYVLTLR